VHLFDDTTAAIDVRTDVSDALATEHADADSFAGLTASRSRGSNVPIEDATAGDIRG